MFKSSSHLLRYVLVSLLAIQGLCSAIAVEKNQTLEGNSERDQGELAVRTSDEYTIIHKWDADGAATVIGSAAGVGLVIVGAVNAWIGYEGNKPDAQKICGKSSIISITDDGVGYKYYVYSYTTGSNCDSTQRAKTITNALSDAFDQLHSEGASAVCLDFDHHGTWHGVIGLATDSSGHDPQAACAGHHGGAKRSNAGFPELEANKVAKRKEIGLVKRTPISVSQEREMSGSTKFSPPNKSQAVIIGIADKIYQQSAAKSCDPVTGRLTDSDGVDYNYYYYASGRNCDTTAQLKTIVTALDDAWEDLGSISALCMTMRHGDGTWRGHLGISAMQSEYPAQKLC
ncbi:hypothetical protein N7476_011583 [Penicillium atrosanguineum]|uniref:Secreted protein CSS2 C-terminal domain-containing protein n=1 Tax=Penicillium atrosanguineum TaxID=1132637 RepID=A0A9W9PMV9_9EURO|nr:hypothetical protein N7476_011583 [Penicillium atrosanguineum]